MNAWIVFPWGSVTAGLWTGKLGLAHTDGLHMLTLTMSHLVSIFLQRSSMTVTSHQLDTGRVSFLSLIFFFVSLYMIAGCGVLEARAQFPD